MAMYDIYVVGMREEMHADKGPGEDYVYNDMVDQSNSRYVLFCKTCEGRTLFTITLETVDGWCGSGYTTASWGEMSIERVTSFGPATHLPKDHKLKLDGASFDASLLSGLIYEAISFESTNDVYEDAEISNNVFKYSGDGDDPYYPSGYAYVHEDLFTKLPRAFDERPVWILSGSSGTGKSTFGMILENSGKTVYETDSANNGNLPSEIWADIIVVGNKWKNVTVERVKEHLPEGCKPVDVQFNM